MVNRAILFAALLAAVAFAGCADDAPAGTFISSGHALIMDGSIDIDFQPFVDPLNNPDTNTQCAQDQIPALPAEQRCTQPYSYFNAHFMSLSDPGMDGYTIVALGADGVQEIIKLTEADGMYTGENNFTFDMAGLYSVLELRLGDFVLATAPATEGTQIFALADSAVRTQAEGTYAGMLLELTISGIPQNVTAMGWLVATGEGGEITHDESFPVANGVVEHTAKINVGDYTAFHIHVGNSKVNIATAAILAA